MSKQTRVQNLAPKPTHSLKACFRLPGDINVLVGNIHGAAIVGQPASKKDRHTRCRVDYMRRVIVEALYLSSENQIQQFFLAANWNMTGKLVRKALERFPTVQQWDVTNTGSKNTWIIANSELRHMILPAAPLRPRGADDTGPEVIATFMLAGPLKNTSKGLGT